MQTRLTLINRIKNKFDDRSWEEFSKIYRPYIAVMIRNMNVNENEIDDIIQSVLLTCWNKLPEFDYNPETGRFRFWLRRIASYIVSNHFRKSGRRQELQEDLEIPLTVSPEIEEMAEKEWKAFISRKAWENVKESLSHNAVYSFEALVAGKKAAEIALKLGIEENSVHAHKSRIEKKLFKEIQFLKEELD